MKQKIFLLMLLMVASVVSSATIPAFSTGQLKWQLCDTYNLTKYDCDVWWETETNPYYIQEPTINNNDFFNKSEIKNIFYNKSEIKSLANAGIFNLNDSNFFNKSEIDKMMNVLKREILQNMSNKFVLEDDFDSRLDNLSDDSNISDSTILIAIGMILLVGVGIFFISQKTESKSQESNYIQANPKIRSRKSLDYESDIKGAISQNPLTHGNINTTTEEQR
jgi:hypothetical protein